MKCRQSARRPRAEPAELWKRLLRLLIMSASKRPQPRPILSRNEHLNHNEMRNLIGEIKCCGSFVAAGASAESDEVNNFISDCTGACKGIREA